MQIKQLLMWWNYDFSLSEIGLNSVFLAWHMVNVAGITRESRGNFSILRRLKDDIEYILRQDPRPGYQNDPKREYKLDYAGLTVTFQVQSEEEEGKENAKGMKSEGGESAKGMKSEGRESAKGMSRGKVIVKRIEKRPKWSSVH